MNDCTFFKLQLSAPVDDFILNFQELISLFLEHMPGEHVDGLTKRFFNIARLQDPFAVNSALQLKKIEPYKSNENPLALLHNDLMKLTNGTEHLIAYLNALLAFTPKLSARQLSIETNIFGPSVDLHWKAIALRCLMKNYFQTNFNESGDQLIINESLKLVDELYGRAKSSKELLLYNV